MGKKKASNSDIIKVFLRRGDQFEPLTAAEVAEEVGLSRRGTSERLSELADHSPPALKTKKTGAKGRVWWPNADLWYPELSQMKLRNVSTADVLERLDGRQTGSDDHEHPALERTLQELNIPGSGEIVVARRDAIRDIHQRLQNEGQASRRELCDIIDPGALGYEDVDSFWSNLILRKNVMRELPGVMPPGEGGHYYRYVPE